MRFLPRFTQFGQLELIEAYEYYDKPLLASCINAANHIYLAVLIDETEQVEAWYFVGISPVRFQHIRSGAIDLHNAFRLSEDGAVTEVRIPIGNNTEPLGTYRIDTVDLRDEQLPYLGETLNLKTETLPKLLESVSRKAGQAKREFLKLSLESKSLFRTEVPARLMSDVLHAFQDTIDAIGQTLKGEVTTRGPVPSHIRSQMELMVTEIGAGSFEIELASASLVDLFDNSDVGKALGELVSLISLGDNEERLQEQLRYLKIRVAAKYANLLKSISEQVEATNFEWGSPSRQEILTVSMSAEKARSIIEIIEHTELEPPEEFTVRGQLKGADLAKKNYRIWTKDLEGKTLSYSGRAADSAMNSLRGARLDNEYLVTLEKINTVNAMTGEVEEKYVLVQLND